MCKVSHYVFFRIIVNDSCYTNCLAAGRSFGSPLLSVESTSVRKGHLQSCRYQFWHQMHHQEYSKALVLGIDGYPMHNLSHYLETEFSFIERGD